MTTRDEALKTLDGIRDAVKYCNDRDYFEVDGSTIEELKDFINSHFEMVERVERVEAENKRLVMGDNPTMQELLGTLLQSEINKLQARLEAAELALEMAAGFTDRLYRKDFFVAYDNWRAIKEGK